MYLHTDHNAAYPAQTQSSAYSAICAVSRYQNLRSVFVLGCLNNHLVGRVDNTFNCFSVLRHNSAIMRYSKEAVVKLLSAYDAKMVRLLKPQASCRKNHLGNVNWYGGHDKVHSPSFPEHNTR